MKQPPVPPGREPVIAAIANRIGGNPSVYVPDGARMLTAGRADALVHIDPMEHRRRQGDGLGAVTQLWLIDALMNLPLGHPVPLSSLDRDERWAIDRAPRGAVARGESTVTRVCRPVATIAAVVVWHDRLGAAIGRPAPFHRLASRIIVLPEIPCDFGQIAWQARFHGIGVWTPTTTGAAELIPADIYTPRYYMPARWAISEYAYRTWLAGIRVPHG